MVVISVRFGDNWSIGLVNIDDTYAHNPNSSISFNCFSKSIDINYNTVCKDTHSIKVIKIMNITF